MIHNSNAPVSGSGGGAGGYTHTFSISDWVSAGGEVTITIPAATHGLTGNAVDCQAFTLSSGVYRQSTWAALETYATVSGNGDIVVHYPNATGYDGMVVLSAYAL